MSTNRRSTLISVLVALTVAALLAGPAAAAPESRPIKVMTQNVYLGSDLVPVLQATSVPQLLVGATAVWRQVQGNDFPSRARALAARIVDADPMIVGLQEVSKWYVGDVGVVDGPATRATNVAYDYLALLLAALAEAGTPYEALELRVEFDAEAPTLLGHDVRLEQRDVILVRSGLPDDELRVLSSAQGSYVANEPIVLGPLTIPVHRGWSSVDVVANGRLLRVVNTHLEPEDVELRLAQAQELVAPGGPADAAIPVAIVGDLNSGPLPADPAAYEAIRGVGFRDAWSELYPQAGFTCCEAADLRNATSQLSRRIDVVLFDSGTPRRARTYGPDGDGRTPAGLWPSDHAGVVAALVP